MGVGHVPPGTLRQAGQGDDVPRRQHRRAGAALADLSRDRRRLARLGEDVAARFLERRGATIVARNLHIAGGELDIVMSLHGVLACVEVKTVGSTATAEGPIERLSPGKLHQVRSLANRLAAAERRPVRVDFVGVAVGIHGATVEWRTAVA